MKQMNELNIDLIKFVSGSEYTSLGDSSIVELITEKSIIWHAEERILSVFNYKIEEELK